MGDDLVLRTRVAVARRNLKRVRQLSQTIKTRLAGLGEFLDLPEKLRSDLEAAWDMTHDLESLAQRHQDQSPQLFDQVQSLKQQLNTIWRDLKQKCDEADRLRNELDQLSKRKDVDENLLESAKQFERDLTVSNYFQSQKRIGALFSEYVDLLRGVALRSAGFGDDDAQLSELFLIADQLPSLWGPVDRWSWQSLAVPSQQDGNGSTEAMVLRVGFPEWTIWALPFVQHGFGYVFAKRRQLAVPADATLSAALADATKAAALADALATVALLVAGRESEAFARVLKFMDANRQDVDYAQTMMLIEYLFGGGRVAEVEMLLQRGLGHPEAGLAGLLGTTVVTLLSGRPGAVIPTNRRLLAELLGLVDRQLLSAPDDPALLRIRARSLIHLGRYQDALGAVDAIPDRDDGEASARWLRIIVLARLHDYQAALQDFDLLPLERASTSWAFAIRTYLLQNLGQHSRALEVGAQALQRYPDHLDVQLAYALAVEAAGEPDRALELIGELLRGRPDDADLLTVDGALLHRLGRLPEATAALQHAVDKNPQDVEARATLADLLAAGDDIDGAIAHLDIAMSDDPDRADLLVERARILLRVDRTIEALESVDLAQRGDAGGAEVLGLRADILLELGRKEEAAAWYERAFREAGAAGSSASEHYATSLEQIASDLFNDGTHFAEALDCLQPLTAAGVLSVTGMGMRAELLRLTGRYTQALEQADRAIAAGADRAWTSATKAQALADLSRSQEALDILDEVLAGTPDYLWARFTAISAQGEVGRGGDSLAALDQYFPERDAPQGWETASQLTRARFFLDLGRYDEAISKLSSLGGKEGIVDADRAYLRGVLGVAYNRLGRVDEAADQLRESIRLFGDETPKWAQVELADALARREERITGEAATLYRSVVTTIPPELVPRERANRAWALFRLGQVDEAIAEYQTALAAAADPLGEVRFHFVAMLHATGQPQAEDELERALATTAALPDRDQAREVLHEGRYLLDLLAHDQAHASAAEQLVHLSERLAKQNLDGIAHNRARA